MYGLRTSLSKSLSGGDFDNINAILGSSSFKGKPTSSWENEVDKDGSLFYLDVVGKTSKVDDVFPKTLVPQPCCESSTGWCSTRTCKCSHSEDTGYSTDNDQPSPKNDEKVKKSGIFSSFLKRKESKSSSVETKEACSEAECFCPDMQSVKEVILLVDPGLRPVGRPGETLCERLLGIIPGIVGTNGHTQKKTDVDKDKIVIKGFVPDGAAIGVKDIRIGDYLKSIDGQDTGWSSIDAMLKSILTPKKVKLKLESPQDALVPDASPPSSPTDPRYESLVELASELEQLRIPGGDNSLGVFYISMEGITSDDIVDQEDLVYSYPPGDTLLASLRGMFYTISHLLKEIVASDVKHSSLLIDGDLVHAAYHMEGREILLLVVPDKWCSVSVLNHLLADIVRLLRFLVGGVEEALRQNKHRYLVDQLFSLLFKSLSGETRTGPVNQPHSHPSLVKAAVNQNLCLPSLVGAFAHSGHVQYLPLSNDIMLHISNTMSDFEASDFVDMSDTFYGCRRSYTILGSSVFYKGHLLCSHMSRDELHDVHNYLSYHALLALTANQKVSQLVVWREIFPTRFNYEVSEINNTFGYSEPHARWFLLVLGLKHGLLAVVLEAGGCATQHHGRACPDPFYIDQARCMLIQIQTSEVIGHCEARLAGSGLPQTINIDNFLSKTATDLGGVIRDETVVRSHAPVISPRYSRHHRRKGSVESDASSESGSSDGLFRSQRRHRMFPEGRELAPVNGITTTAVRELGPKLGDGEENCIFHYCNLKSMEGLVISSPNSDAPIHSDLLHTFYKCCAQIQEMFSNVKSHRALLDQEEEPVFFPDGNLVSVREHGVLFHVQTGGDNHKSKQSLAYWVVGRKYSRPVKQEMYVCFHENTPQNVVEVAFRLGFGLLSPG